MNANTISLGVFAVATMVAVIVAFHALAREARLADRLEDTQADVAEIMVISNQYYDALQKAKFRIAVLEAKLEQCKDVMAVNDTVNYDAIFHNFVDSRSLDITL